MIEYRPSNTFSSEQGLDASTVIDRSASFNFVNEFIQLFVGPPLVSVYRVEELQADVKRVTIWNLNYIRQTTK